MGIVKDISSKIRSAAATYNQGDQRSGLADCLYYVSAKITPKKMEMCI